MVELAFNELSFEEYGDKIKVTFLRLYYLYIEKQALEKIGKFKIKPNSIIFDGISEQKAANKFNILLLKGFENLRNKLTGKKTVYVHQFSGIPLIGSNAFGLIDRNSSIIEVRPMTGCNLNCIYCSVDQDLRQVDFVVEKDYLVNEFKRLIEYKKEKGFEAHIGTQGEPLFYSPLPELVKDLAAIPEIKTIALDTNGTLLTEELVDSLVNSGLTRFCFSINTLDTELARKIAGAAYNISYVMKILEYISKQKCELLIAPVLIPGINEDEMPKLIELAKRLKCKIGIQNFLSYKLGKNPAKQMDWEKFLDKLKKWESEYGVKLLLSKEDFDIKQTKPLPKPFKKGDVVKAKLVCAGRLKGEMIAVASDRCITVSNCKVRENISIRVKITRTKHNIFYAVTI